jgi:hypothetical protein
MARILKPVLTTFGGVSNIMMYLVKFHVLMAACIKMTVFQDIVLCT